jgi:hypothetical protein
MNLTDAEVRQLLYCAAEELRARAAGKPPGPAPWLAKLVRRLELEVAVSSTRQQSGGGGTELNHEDDDPIGTVEAAAILRWDIRKVQRRATDLDGQRVSGRWVFSETTVRQYGEALTDARTVA